MTIAFYLPQFHAIPENDDWWGAGFTEWTNVKRAVPAYRGHVQPNEPATPFGEYNLLDPSVVEWQTKIAMENGIDAFCYYHYWFAGVRLLEQPLDNYLESQISMPFAICWANENWSRRWDGKNHEILMAQDYDNETPRRVFESFVPYLSDSRYVRRDNKCVLLVHRVDHLPDAKHYASEWRRLAHEHNIGELWLVASETSPGLDPRDFGFDAAAEFPPVGDNTIASALLHPPNSLNPDFRGRLMSYSRLARWYENRSTPPFPRHRGLVPRWDNSPRRMLKATLFHGSTPERYGLWLTRARRDEQEQRPGTGLVFVNAWNEWAEGAYLEPDHQYGDAYLRASNWNIHVESNFRHPRVSHPFIAHLSWAFAQSLLQAVASTVKNFAKHCQRKLVR
ncbi:glycoside hydrolase family 99-like domain-containing protein [Spongisporangium articulatum]|uniref:Glycoside hydrolase family 99-like domain-containing protein n=1 Tax=Spongisporangium articulatum TaxID=3362603 RepID=A0ABW8ANC6_9ACTN